MYVMQIDFKQENGIKNYIDIFSRIFILDKEINIIFVGLLLSFCDLHFFD
jgi:hypothetical protein